MVLKGTWLSDHDEKRTMAEGDLLFLIVVSSLGLSLKYPFSLHLWW